MYEEEDELPDFLEAAADAEDDDDAFDESGRGYLTTDEAHDAKGEPESAEDPEAYK